METTTATRPTLQSVLDNLVLGRGLTGLKLEVLSDAEIDVLTDELRRLKNVRRAHRPFLYLPVFSDAGLLREALVADLATWIVAGFVRPDRARRWHRGVRRLELLVNTRRNLLIDQLYADAALLLGAVDDADLVRVSELS